MHLLDVPQPFVQLLYLSLLILRLQSWTMVVQSAHKHRPRKYSLPRESAVYTLGEDTLGRHK